MWPACYVLNRTTSRFARPCALLGPAAAKICAPSEQKSDLTSFRPTHKTFWHRALPRRVLHAPRESTSACATESFDLLQSEGENARR